MSKINIVLAKVENGKLTWQEAEPLIKAIIRDEIIGNTIAASNTKLWSEINSYRKELLKRLEQS